MATHYIENASSGNQYHFDASSNTTSQAQRSTQDRTYASPVAITTTVGPSEFSFNPAGVPGVRPQQQQQVRSDRNTYNENDLHHLPQQHQSVAGFNKSVSQQQYQSSPSPVPQVRATVRSVSSQEQQFASSAQYQQQQQQQRPPQQGYINYERQSSPQSPLISPQHHQYQYDSRPQAGQPTGVSGYYQTPGSVQHPHQELNQRTESPSRGREQHVQAQQVSVRSMSSSSHQQHESSGAAAAGGYPQPQSQPSPQQHSSSQSSPQQLQQQEDQLQQYYSQLTPEQYQQLLRQQQIQRQQQDELKRQQLAQQQYYLQQQQERQRTEQQQQHQPGRASQEPQRYDEHQQRRVQQVPSNQEQQYRQQGQDQYDVYHQRSQQIQSSVSPNLNQDPYRQQQQQPHGQQGQLDAYYEQQRRAAAQQSSSTYQQEQLRSTVSGGQPYQQISPNQVQQSPRVRTDSERQHQDEQDYYAAQLTRQQQQEREHAAQIEAAQRQQAAQRAQQEREHAAQLEAAQRQQAIQRAQQQQYQEQQQLIMQAQQPAQPVGIRGLMNKFTGPTKIPTHEPKHKTTTSQHYSTSTYASSTGTAGQGTATTTTTNRAAKTYSMTYSALPKPHEPPVNSAEYYQMMQQGSTSNASSNVQQSAAPPHIQGPAPGFGALRDRFKTGSFSEGTSPIQDIRRQQQSDTGNSGLSSLRDQYVNRAKESTQSQEASFSQRIQSVSRSIVGEDQPREQHQTPAAPPSTPQIPQQEESYVQSQSTDDQVALSEAVVAEDGSSLGVSSLEHDNTVTDTPTESSN